MSTEEDDWLSPNDAARTLRVGLKALERWVDGGMIGKRERDGTTWLSGSDVARLRLDRVPLEDADGPANALLAAALEGDVDAAMRIVRAQTSAIGSLAVALEVLVVPCLVEVGARWQGGKYLVSDEHVVSSVFSDVLVHLCHDYRAAETRGRAACFVLGDDPHSLGARLCHACLENRGFRTYFLGSGVPVDDACAWVRRTENLDILCVSLPVTAKGSVAERELGKLALAAPNAKIFLGGGGAARVAAIPARSTVLTSLFELESLLLLKESEERQPEDPFVPQDGHANVVLRGRKVL